MRILVITLYYHPDIGANAVIVTQLCQELANRGHQLMVVTGFPHYADNTLERRYRGKLLASERTGQLRVIRTYLYTSPHKASFLVRFLNYVSFNILSTLAGLFSGPQDVILAPSPPLTIGLSAAIIGFFKRIPYVYNVQDINPDVLIKLGILKNRLFISFSKWLERFVYRCAAVITVLSEGFQNNLLGKGVAPEKIQIIPNFIDPEFISPRPKGNDFSRAHHLEGKFVVLYAGNLGHSQNLEDLLQCASSMSSDPDLLFMIVGNGSRKPLLEKLAEDLQLGNLVFLPFQPLDAVPQIYGAADVCLVTLKRGIALDSVPSKIYTIMSAARPVLAAVDPGSDAWKLVERAQCGVCLEPENPQALQEAISTMRSQPARLAAMGEKGRQYVLENHTCSQIGEQYQQLLMRIANEKRC